MGAAAASASIRLAGHVSDNAVGDVLDLSVGQSVLHAEGDNQSVHLLCVLITPVY